MNEREVTDQDGLAWKCVQALGSVSNGGLQVKDVEHKENQDSVDVVCTPSGKEQSVRLSLRQDWQKLSDEELVSEISQAKQRNG